MSDQRDRSDVPPRQRWRDYRTATGRSPFSQFMAGLPREDQGEVLAAMKVVADQGVRGSSRHLEGQIWEVRARGRQASYRVLFAQEGARGRVLLALDGFRKQSQKTPTASIRLAKQRLSDWRRRGVARRSPERSRSIGR